MHIVQHGVTLGGSTLPKSPCQKVVSRWRKSTQVVDFFSVPAPAYCGKPEVRPRLRAPGRISPIPCAPPTPTRLTSTLSPAGPRSCIAASTAIAAPRRDHSRVSAEPARRALFLDPMPLHIPKTYEANPFVLELFLLMCRRSRSRRSTRRSKYSN